jgi:hypothetical protein
VSTFSRETTAGTVGERLFGRGTPAGARCGARGRHPPIGSPAVSRETCLSARRNMRRGCGNRRTMTRGDVERPWARGRPMESTVDGWASACHVCPREDGSAAAARIMERRDRGQRMGTNPGETTVSRKTDLPANAHALSIGTIMVWERAAEQPRAVMVHTGCASPVCTYMLTHNKRPPACRGVRCTCVINKQRQAVTCKVLAVCAHP